MMEEVWLINKKIWLESSYETPGNIKKLFKIEISESNLIEE